MGKKHKKLPVRENKMADKPKPVAQTFTIPRPLLWLSMAVLAVYLPSLSLGFTDLDDSIFIREMRAYTSELSNLAVSFTRGVFDPVNDTYYRPMFLNAMILNYQLSGDHVAGYHLVNVLLHLTAVLLLFRLLEQLSVQRLHAFILALIFAVHPVLTQAVAWIPGRNDTLMAVFILGFLIQSFNYIRNGKPIALVYTCLLLSLAFFTKETALFAPAAAFILLIIVAGNQWNNKKMLVQYGVWIIAMVIYLSVRAMATIQSSAIAPAEMIQDFISRLPLLIQYLGKIFLPFNLSVFPVMEDTVYYYGILALLLLPVGILTAKEKNTRHILGGFLLFLLFLTPALLVPRSLNEQTFEHRLYLPLIGILLILPQTILFRNRLKPASLLSCFVAGCIVLSVLNYRHQQYFRDAFTFWEQAYTTSPHSAYAVMMYGARVQDQQEGFKLMREAYRLNPKEKYLNYYYGVMLQEQDSVLESEKYLLQEKNASGYYQCDFHLAKVAYYKKDLHQSAAYLAEFLEKDPGHRMANNNLLLLYIETGQKQQAQVQADRMEQVGLPVPTATRQQIRHMP